MANLLSQEMMEKKFIAQTTGSVIKGMAKGSDYYASEEVNIFLDETSVKVEALERRNETLEQENRNLRQRENVATGVPVEVELTQQEEQAKTDYFKKLGEFDQLEKIYKISIHGAHKEINRYVTEEKEKVTIEAEQILKEANEKAMEITTKANEMWEEKTREVRQMEEQLRVMKEHFQMAFQSMNEANK